jgi:AmiR/NasT family two-component response regulator
MPQVTPIIGVQELGATFKTRIAKAASLLVDNYNISEHNAYKGLRHGRLNRVFELASVLY